MSLDELTDDVDAEYRRLGDALTVDLDAETKNELAMLSAALDPEMDELVHRAIHAVFQTAVETGNLDFHLRRGYDVTYDEYLSGMTFEEMTGDVQYPQTEEDGQRYLF